MTTKTKHKLRVSSTIYIEEELTEGNNKFVAVYQFIGNSKTVRFRGFELYVKDKVVYVDRKNEYNSALFLYPRHNHIRIGPQSDKSKDYYEGCIKRKDLPLKYKNWKNRSHVKISKEIIQKLETTTNLRYDKTFTKS